MSVLEFIDSDVFTPVYNNDIPLINSPNVNRICSELFYAIKNREEIFLYGDYDMDGFCSVGVWKEVLCLAGATPPTLFRYQNRTHHVDKAILKQLRENSPNSRVVLICDTGSSSEDFPTIQMISMMGKLPIVIDHHEYAGHYSADSTYRPIFNTVEEANCLANAKVSGAYASLLVAKVLCEKYLGCPLSYNAKVFALASMYADSVDMSSPLARALYNSVAITGASGPDMFAQLNEWKYLYGRRFFSFIVAPKLNGCFRTEQFGILNDVLGAPTKYELQDATRRLCAVHQEASNLTKIFVSEFTRHRIGDIVLCVHNQNDETQAMHIRNFTGVVATRIAHEEQAIAIVVVRNSHYYDGSFRDFYSRPMLSTFQLFCHAGGHDSAFGVAFNDIDDFKRHLVHLNKVLNTEYAKSFVTLSSAVVESDDDIDALAMYNEYMNMRPSVVVHHKVKDLVLARNTAFNKYYTVGLPTKRQLMTKRQLQEGSSVLIEPMLCRGVELRERE